MSRVFDAAQAPDVQDLSRRTASALMSAADPVAALREYQDQRMQAMNKLIVKNHTLGAERVMQIVEERAPNGFSDIEDVISRQELTEASAGFLKEAGYDAETIHSRPPYVGNRI
jgi:hypothetical protein